MKKKRPKHLDLLKIKQPMPAVVSLLHRISGALLFFPGIPVLLFCLQMILGSPQGYAQFQSLLISPFAKVGLILSFWFFIHHFFAGIRFLALDLHVGIELQQARLSSKATLAAGIVFTLLFGISVW